MYAMLVRHGEVARREVVALRRERRRLQGALFRQRLGVSTLELEPVNHSELGVHYCNLPRVCGVRPASPLLAARGWMGWIGAGGRGERELRTQRSGPNARGGLPGLDGGAGEFARFA